MNFCKAEALPIYRACEISLVICECEKKSVKNNPSMIEYK